jgi:hypothetical protein
MDFWDIINMTREKGSKYKQILIKYYDVDRC